jgi:hypothetical protein
LGISHIDTIKGKPGFDRRTRIAAWALERAPSDGVGG